MKICATCAVEYDEPVPSVCPICADERQYLPADGQRWTDLAELRSQGHAVSWTQTEPGVFGLTAGVGIDQTAQLVITPAGSLLWDPTGYLDEAAVRRIRGFGPVLAVAASHPHMFGVQVEWARALDAPVLVCADDREWVGRSDPTIEYWAGERTITDGLTLHQLGGHFPGSAVAVWAAGAEGRGLLLSGDTIAPNPDRRSVTFLRSYPNRIPLSAAVVGRIAARTDELIFDRLVGNFGGSIDTDARAVVRFSADRYRAWVAGEFDHLT